MVGRVFSILILFYILSLAGFFIYCLAVFTPQKVLPSFQLKYAFQQGFLLFIQYLIPVHVSGIAVAFALGGGSGRRVGVAVNRAESFKKAATPLIAALIFLSLTYTVFFEALTPYVRDRIAGMEYQSGLARELLRQAKDARSRGDFVSALNDADRYLAIDKDNASVLEMKSDLESSAAKQKLAARESSQAAPAPNTGESAASLVEKARAYFEKRDYFSAHYYATQAFQNEPGRGDAIRLAAEAWDKIVGLSPAQADAQSAALFEGKKKAYALLESNPIGAYYAFLDLSSKYPGDADVVQFLEEARRRMVSLTFFTGDAEQAAALPGTRHILFFNGAESGVMNAVAIGKMVEMGKDVYFTDVEAVSYRQDGTVVYHLGAKYAKLDAGNTLLLRGVDKRSAGAQSLPVYYAGTRPAEERDILAIRPTPREMRALSVDSGGVSSLGLTDLWRMRSSLTSYGVMDREISVGIVMDVLMPFIFLTLSFLAASFGWAFRPRFLGRPPARLFFFIPLVPAVAAVLSLVWTYAHGVLLGFVVLSFGLIPALIACLVLELVILVVGLVLLAGQSAEP
jgi:tetratricopeptide (TPR) repeat protein